MNADDDVGAGTNDDGGGGDDDDVTPKKELTEPSMKAVAPCWADDRIRWASIKARRSCSHFLFDLR